MNVEAKIRQFGNQVLAKKEKGNKKSGNSRSKLLKVVMPALSGKLGERLAAALDSPNKFMAVWGDITRKVSKAVNKNAPKPKKEKTDRSLMGNRALASNAADCKCPKENSGADCPLKGCKRKKIEETKE